VGVFSNKRLVLSFLICTFLQVSVISIPALANVFQVMPLTLSQWLYVFILAAMPVFLVELQKKFIN
jgi:Ca2+-transporting ATPase